MVKLASWNVNSIHVRLEQLLSWMQESNIDILALQETKTLDEKFPRESFEQLGYHIAMSGQKSYNGVAIISKLPLLEVTKAVADYDDEQKRVLAVTVQGVRVINLYVPNGRALDTPFFQYKLEWLRHVLAFIKQEMQRYPKVAVVGDFNIAPEDIDVHDIEAWQGSVMVSDLERAAFQSLVTMGLKDSFRHCNPESIAYSWWDYRAGSFRRNRGLRIDHILLSEALCQTCSQSGIDVTPRKDSRPSDHAPVWVTLES